MTQLHAQRLGKWGEKAAASYLADHGYQIIEANHRTPFGEIDLVTRLEDTLVFVEVKTRASSSLGMPEISITARKRLHMIQSAEYYIQNHSPSSGTWRIDVVSIQRQAAGQPPIIAHFENAVA